MKFSAHQSEVSQAIAIVGRVATTRGTIPAMANILAVADAAGTLTLSGYDGEQALSMTIPASVEQAGALAVPAKLWGDLASKMPKEALTFEMEETTLKMGFGKSAFNLECAPADEFPAIPTQGNTPPLLIPASALLDGIEKVLPAIDVTASQEILRSIHLLPTSTGVELASTDGHRLAVVPAARVASDEDGAGMECNVPGLTMQLLARILKQGEPDDEVQLYLDEDPIAAVHFVTAHGTLMARVTDGQYPNYGGLIPKAFGTVIKLSASALEAALKRIAVLAVFKNDTVDIQIDGDRLTLKVPDSDVGSGLETVPATVAGNWELGAALSINCQYLLDGLTVAAAEMIEISLNTSTSPVVLRPAGGEGETYLLMPVQRRDRR
jgi:DNA polymerase III subunit beta